MDPLGINFSQACLAYKWRCAKCGEIALEARYIRRGDMPYRPTLPAGWHQLDWDFYCPAHTVLILVDGAPVPA